MIARRLQGLGHDATTVHDEGLTGTGDEDLLSAAAEHDRAVLTNNARHFVPLVRRWAAEGRSHAGIVLTADASMPRGSAAIGLYVETLTTLFEENPRGDALRDQVRWLP